MLPYKFVFEMNWLAIVLAPLLRTVVLVLGRLLLCAMQRSLVESDGNVLSTGNITKSKERKAKLLFKTDEKVQPNEHILDPLNSIQRLCMSFFLHLFAC